MYFVIRSTYGFAKAEDATGASTASNARLILFASNFAIGSPFVGDSMPNTTDGVPKSGVRRQTRIILSRNTCVLRAAALRADTEPHVECGATEVWPQS